MEHIPKTLNKRLKDEASGGSLQEDSLAALENELNRVITFMKSRGFLHFDAHFHNILASQSHVYFADFGLAISRKFELSLEEMAFFDMHRDYDRYYVVTELVINAITSTVPSDKLDEVFTGYFSPEGNMATLPHSIAPLAKRYRPIVLLMDAFFQGLREGSKDIPFPEAELAHEWSELSPAD